MEVTTIAVLIDQSSVYVKLTNQIKRGDINDNKFAG